MASPTPTTKYYDEVREEDKKTLLLAVILYVIILEVKWDDIKKDVLERKWETLMKRRLEAVDLEEKIRNYAYKKIGSSLTPDDLETLKICVLHVSNEEKSEHVDEKE